MWYIVLIMVIALLVFALLAQQKAANKQTDEQAILLKDYQKRVDEQQKLLDDYRALEKNFDSVGQGYEQALLAFDKMEEEKHKQQETINNLEQRLHDVQERATQLSEMAHHNYGYVQQLAREAADEAAKLGGAPRLMAAVRKMQDLNELGSQTAINTGEQTTPRTIAEQAISESGIANVNYLQFSLLLTDEANEATLRTAPDKAARVVALLLDNAMKFTTEGKVTLYVNAEEQHIKFIVEDTGMGVPTDEAEHIFEPYVQLNNYFGGIGVGLVVARSIASRLDGDVALDTTYEGPGARFVFTLPM